MIHYYIFLKSKMITLPFYNVFLGGSLRLLSFRGLLREGANIYTYGVVVTFLQVYLLILFTIHPTTESLKVFTEKRRRISSSFIRSLVHYNITYIQYIIFYIITLSFGLYQIICITVRLDITYLIITGYPRKCVTMRCVIYDVDNYIESGKTMASLMIKKPFSSEWLHLPGNKYDPALDNYLPHLPPHLPTAQTQSA